MEWVCKKIEKYVAQERVEDSITTEKNIELYDEILLKHKNTIFINKPVPSEKLLENGRDKFIELPVDMQIMTLYQALKLTSIGTGEANMETIGEGKRCGLLKASKTISQCKEMKLIYQSTTGLYSREIDLLTV